MNYERHYNLLILKHGNAMPSDASVCEHHIIPQSMDGPDKPENLVYLDARCHYLAHWLLWRIHRNKPMAHALWMMSICGKYRAIAYDEAREAHSWAMKGKNNHCYGKKLTAETRAKISEANKGRLHTDESKAKMSEAKKGRKFSAEHKRKIGESNKGRVVTSETRKKISESLKGKPNGRLGKKHSESSKRKIGKAHKGRQISPAWRKKLSESLKLYHKKRKLNALSNRLDKAFEKLQA